MRIVGCEPEESAQLQILASQVICRQDIVYFSIATEYGILSFESRREDIRTSEQDVGVETTTRKTISQSLLDGISTNLVQTEHRQEVEDGDDFVLRSSNI